MTLFVLDVDFGADDSATLARAKRYVESIQLGWPTVGVTRRKAVVRAVCKHHEPLASLMNKVMSSTSPEANGEFTLHLSRRLDEDWGSGAPK